MKWETPVTTGSNPSARNAHSMINYNNRLILFGGHSGQTHLFDVYTFNIENFNWNAVNTLGCPP